MKKKLFKNKYGNRNHFKHKRKRTSLSISLLLKIYKFLLKIIKLLFFLFTIKLILIKNQFDNDIVSKRQYKDEYIQKVINVLLSSVEQVLLTTFGKILPLKNLTHKNFNLYKNWYIQKYSNPNIYKILTLFS